MAIELNVKKSKQFLQRFYTFWGISIFVQAKYAFWRMSIFAFKLNMQIMHVGTCQFLHQAKS